MLAFISSECPVQKLCLWAVMNEPAYYRRNTKHSTIDFRFENLLEGCYYATSQQGSFDMANAGNDPDMVRFVLESERISGIKMPSEEAHLKRPGTIRHMECAKIIASGYNIVNAELINCTLTGRTGDWFRSGVEGALQGVIPEGEHVPKIMSAFSEEVQQGVTELKERCASQEARADFAWNMHDKLICNHAFKEANGRTARMHLNQIRLRLGLPWLVITYEGSKDYFRKLSFYRVHTFLPLLHEAEEAA